MGGLSEEWLRNNEGGDSWSPYDIVGHLIFGEKTDWIDRIKIILGDSMDKKFKPFDRLGQFNEDQNRPVSILLKEFRDLRTQNIQLLISLNIQDQDFTRIGFHPEFGEVTLEQLIATWTVHDLGHIAQISRVMAKQYKVEVGPWVNYLGVLKK